MKIRSVHTFSSFVCVLIATATACVMSPSITNAQTNLSIDFSTPANGFEDTVFNGTITFAPPSMVVTGSVTSGQSIVPSSNVDVSGNNVSVTPLSNQNGNVTVQLVGKTPGSTNIVSFVVDFEAVNDAPTNTFIGNVSVNEDETTNRLFTVGDVDDTAGSLDVIVSANNPSLINVSGANVSGAGANKTLTLTPNPDQFGSATVTVKVADGFLTNTSTFVLTVLPVNDVPTNTPINNVTFNEDTTTNRLFTIGDVDNTVGSLTVNAFANNPALINVSAANITGGGANKTLTLTPLPNQNGSATVTVTVTDGALTNVNTFTMKVNPVPDRPTITGLVNTLIFDNVAATVLTGIVVGDVDHNTPDPENLTATLSMIADFASFSGGSTNYVTNGNPAQVTAAIQSLQIQPAENFSPPNTTNTVAITISINDGVLSSNTTRNIRIVSLNDPPTLTGGLLTNQMVEGATIQPFVVTSIDDVDVGDNSFSFAIQLVNTNQATLGSFDQTPALTNVSSIAIQDFLLNLQYTAASGVMTGSSEVVRFRYLVLDGYGGSAAVTNSLTIFQSRTPPSISGVPVQTVNITDDTLGHIPFPTVTVADPDEGGNQLLTASLSSSVPALGSFTQSSFSNMTPAQLTAALRLVEFNAVDGLLPVNASSNTVLTITVVDVSGLTNRNNNLTLSIKSVNSAPAILGVPSTNQQPVLLAPVEPILPFANVGLSNDDTNNVTLTIVMDDPAKGSLTNLSSFTELVAGTYEMVGSISNIVHALTNLQYVLNNGFLFPPDDPGGTVFSITATDFALLSSLKTLYIQVQDAPRNHLVTRTVNDGLPGSLTYALATAVNNDFITIALPSYPATIRMPGNSPSMIIRNITIKGPGADLLTISGDNNGDFVADRQIFQIQSKVTIEGVTLSHGVAAYGGIASVLSNGVLTLRNCSVVDSTATFFGGAIDVDGGQLILDGCFIGGNSVSEDQGVSGGAISIYSDFECRIENTTFARNSQPNHDGDGGGALVVEDRNAGSPLNVYLTHCTFAENTDASERASAILSVGFGSRIRPQHCIFSDDSSRNMDVVGSGEIISLGGNICNDSTKTTLTQGGQPQDVYLLDHISDLTLVDALLGPLDETGDHTPFYPVLSGSPAINKASGSGIAIDQRGIIRGTIPDTGAIEFNALRRLVINEIDFDETTLDFVEIFVRRDSAPIDLAGMSLFVNDVKVHEFSSSLIIGTNSSFIVSNAVSTLLNPGFGIVVAFTETPVMVTTSNNPTPVVKPSVTNVNLDYRGIISIGAGGSQLPIARSSYLGTYLNPADGTNLLDITGNSISLAPQFLGFALVPHSLILPGPFDGIDPLIDLSSNPNSIGADAQGTPFGLDNAQPLALPDIFNVLEDDLAELSVLSNDFDGDGKDRVVVVDISTDAGAGTGDAGSTNSQLGADITVDPLASPLRGNSILYDPRFETALQQLPVGVEITDTFYYEIVDIGSGAVEGFPSGTVSNTTVTISNHRLTSNDVIIISGSSRPSYNNSFPVTVINDNSISIPVAYAGAAATNGVWETADPRSPTTRSEASVTIKVSGVNDVPVAVLDVVTNVTEASVVRVMIRPELAGVTNLSFGTDPVPPPDMLTSDLLSNDTDIDTDDTWESLRVVGVLGSVNEISGYSGTAGQLTVTVHSVEHGLSNDDVILISGYGGHPSYNGYQTVTVVDDDTFTIPRFFVDDDAEKGIWVILNDATRYEALTDVGAEVVLTLRANQIEDHIIYDASASAFLNTLAEGELYTNRFYYAVEDSHGAVNVGPVDFVVVGLNDIPVANPDPDVLDGLAPLVMESNSLEDVLSGGLTLMYTLPPTTGGSNLVNLHVLDDSAILPGTIVINDIWYTDEETAIGIDTMDLLANDTDIDTIDILTVVAVDSASREGATVSLGGGMVTYDPSASTNLDALARGELVVDTFNAVISDGMTDGFSTALVAVVVVGLNDFPIAMPDLNGTSEDDVLVFNPIIHPATNPSLHDVEVDINGHIPDDRLTMIRVSNLITIGEARVDIEPESLHYDPTVSDLLNQLADWQSYTDRFDYTVIDNSFIFATDDEFYVGAGSSSNVLDALANDRDFTDSEGILSIVEVGPTLNGGDVIISSNGLYLIYSTPLEFVGDDYFTYTVENDQGDRNHGKIMVRSTIPQLNGVLNAADDVFTVAAGETVELDVAANDNILPYSGSALTVSSNLVSTSFPGQPVLVNNKFVYTATNGLTPLTFVYEVSAGGTSVAQADVTVNIIERRGALEIQDDVYSVLPGSLNNELNVLYNDGLWTSPTSQLRILEILDPAVHGIITTNGAGTAMVYSPDADFIGIEQIRYVATDMIGGTGTGLVSIVAGKVDVASDFFTFATTTNPVPQAMDVLSNDRTMANPPGTLEIVSVIPSNATAIGTLAVNGGSDGLEFFPSNAVGQLDFNYVVRDASVPGRLVTGRVTVATVNSGINANPDRYIVRGGGADYELDVLMNDISYPNVNKTYSILSIGVGADAPDQGGLVSIVNNTLLYTPAPGFFGEESFTYLMSDSVVTDSARVTISVRRGDLFANADTYSVYYALQPGTNLAVQFTLPVTLNDRILPPFDQVISITGVGIDNSNMSNAPSQQGVVGITPDGLSLTYRPVTPAISNYIERFTYEISDGTDRRAEGRVEIFVQNRVSNLVAVTHDDHFTVERNSISNALPLLQNDFVLPGTAAGWSITAVSGTSHGGSVTIVGNQVRYTPPADFVGVDQFSYSTSDGLGGTGNAVVNVRVGSTPVLPDTFTVLSDSVDNELDVLANDILDSAYAGEYVLASVYGVTLGGSASLSGSNTVLYTPDSLYIGSYPYTASFIYEVSDETGINATGFARVIVHETGSDRSTTSITIIVEGRNDQPYIINTPDEISITDKDTAKPFENVLFVEVDEQLMEKVDVSVSLDDAAKGILLNLDGFVETSPGVYTLTNVTAAEATASIFGLVFDPTENRITVPTSEVTYFTISITDNKSPVVYDTNSMVTVTAVNDAPEISGTVAGQVMYQGFPIKLFSAVTITEVDDLTLQLLQVTITLSDASHGSLIDTGSFAAISNGVYQASGITAADATAAMRAMRFAVSSNGVPAGSMQTTLFSIDVEDGFAPTVSDDVTTVIVLSGLEQILTPTVVDTNLLEGIGWAVAMNDDVAVAGAQYAEVNLTTNIFNDGRVVIFERVPNGTNIWTQTYVIPSVTNILDGYFGVSVDIDQETIAVGGEYEPSSPGFRSGRVHIYHRNPTSVVWDLKASIVSPVTNNFARFGATVDLEGDLLAVGAPEALVSGNTSGGAFIFSRHHGGSNNWGLIRSIIPTGTVNNIRFGHDVSLDGETLVVGAPQSTSVPTNRGAVYVYQMNQGGSNMWGFVQRLTSEVASVTARLGASVDVEGDYIVAGAPSESNNIGAAYVFLKLPGTNVWALSQKFLGPSGISNDHFGASVTMDDEVMMVGAPRMRSVISPTTNRVGISYVYTLADGSTNGWQLANFLVPPTNSIYALYGSSMHVFGRRAIVGAPMNKILNANTPILDNGAVYLYSFDINNPPGVITPIDDQYAEINEAYAFPVPTDTFADPDFNDSLTLSLTFPSGGGGLSYEPIAPAITGTPVQLGFIPVNLVATDEGGLSATNAFNVIVLDSELLPPSPSTLWLLLNFGETAATSSNHSVLWAEDSDNDHSDNKQEYVFGGDPNSPDDTGLTWEIDVPNDTGAITFLRRINDPDLTYVLEGTMNPRSGIWYPVNTSLLSETTMPAGDDFELVTLEISLDENEPWEHYRIKVTY